MATLIKFDSEAKAALRAGADVMAKAVGSTLGARGRNVCRQIFGSPKITNDGVTIARAIDLDDPFEKQGADLLKQAAEQTVKQAGDGTTTAIVLAHALLAHGLEAIANGENPMILKQRLEKAGEEVVAKIKARSVAVQTDEDLKNIATLSVENEEYGALIAQAVKTAGPDGQVIVEEGFKPGVTSKEIPGYWFARGWESPYLVTNPDKMEAVLENKDGSLIPILVADRQWNLVGDLMEVFNELKGKGIDKMLIITEEISGELMQFINLNRMKLRFHAVVVKTPYNKDMLDDIALFTKATPITGATGIVDVKVTHLGWFKKCVVTENQTTIIGGEGDIAEQIVSLRKRVEEEEIEHEKKKLEERLARLTGKTVEITVGAQTEAESRYLKDKLDDSVAATKAAVEEGIVPGGGMTLYRIASEIEEPVMAKALQEPFYRIMRNAGAEEEGWAFKDKGGFDVLTMKVVDDVVSAGIIDPTKVTRCAFQNALSVAVMMITTDTLIADKPEAPMKQ